MAIGTVSGTTYTPPTATGVTDNLIGGFKAPLLKDGEVLDASSAFWAATIYGFLGSAVGGMVGRSRALSGKEPMMKFLY